MSLRPARLRVLIGNLEPMLRLGMSRVLAGDDVEVVEEEGPPAEIVARARRMHPNAVVLNLDSSGAHELGEQVRAVAPSAKLILLAADETRMEVLDPGTTTPRRYGSDAPAALVRELSNNHGERT